MIFSLLNVRKKTAASLAGISIAALCLWGLSMWQDISIAELLQVMLATLLMLAALALTAALLIGLFKTVMYLAGSENSSWFEDDPYKDAPRKVERENSE